MGYRAADEGVPVGLEQRRQKTVHPFEGGEAKEDFAAERLEAAGGIRTIVMQQRLPQTVGKPGRKPPRPRIAPLGADAGNQREGLAARLIEKMEAEGVVSSANHVGKREVLAPPGR